LNDLLTWCRVRRPDGEANEVRILLERFVRGDPQDDRSRRALAEQLCRMGRLDEAEAEAARLPDADPDVQAIRARIALNRGDERGVEERLTRGSTASPELNRLRGRRALLSGDAPAALRWYQAADQVEPDHRDTLLGLGQACRLLGDAPAAAKRLQQA